MILPFKEQFVEPIKSGDKIHSIRKWSFTKNGLARWTEGRKIHLATGVRTKDYNCFKEAVCESVQRISIYWRGNKYYPVGMFVDGKELDLDEIEILALNDGFNTVDDFYKWFNKDFTGIIIHWTDLKY